MAIPNVPQKFSQIMIDVSFLGGDYEEYCLLKCKVAEPGRNLPTFRKNILC
jgi:hypothetical protein